MIEKFIDEKEFYFIFTGVRMRVYIPARYVDTAMCEIKADNIKVFGVLPVS